MDQENTNLENKDMNSDIMPEFEEKPYAEEFEEKKDENESSEIQEVVKEKDIFDENEDYDFDMTLYEGDEEGKVEIAKTVTKYQPPKVSGLRSRYSHGSFELERLGDLKKESASYAIKVASYKQDIRILFEYFGILHTMWIIIKPIYGQDISDEFETLKVNCKKELANVKAGDKIKSGVHDSLLKFDEMLQRCMQLSNLGFEVERTIAGTRAAQQIRQ